MLINGAKKYVFIIFSFLRGKFDNTSLLLLKFFPCLHNVKFLEGAAVPSAPFTSASALTIKHIVNVDVNLLFNVNMLSYCTGLLIPFVVICLFELNVFFIYLCSCNSSLF